VKRHCITVIVLWALLFQLLIAVTIPNVRADPIVIEVSRSDQVNIGSGLCLGSNISMPEAYVDIDIVMDIVVEHGFRYIINVSCQFLLQTVSGQNFTTAFVYPSEWGLFSQPEAEFKSFGISVNGSEIDFSVIEWVELMDTYDVNVSKWGWLDSNQFALFSLEMPPNSTYIVSVEADIALHSSAHNFAFAYCIGSARSWDGNTHQVIQMDFKNHTNLLEHGFLPENYEDLTVENETEAIRWDFLISELDENYVTFWAAQHEAPTYERGPFSNPLHIVLAALFIIVLPIVAFSAYCIKTKD
jgi:hypothetical protein